MSLSLSVLHGCTYDCASFGNKLLNLTLL